tara:strand:+ start:194 stop:343 length:150 start_codon:yes stop_codon:yes gene_type:complete
VHSFAPAAEDLPAAHFVHWSSPSSENVPASQNVHAALLKPDEVLNAAVS